MTIPQSERLCPAVADARGPVCDEHLSEQLLICLFAQTSESARHLRAERAWFANLYVAVVAGGLAVSPKGTSDVDRDAAALIMFVLALLSVVAILVSIRHVVELSQAQHRLDIIARHAGVHTLLSAATQDHARLRSLPVRWAFTLFYTIVATTLTYQLWMKLT